MTTTTNLRDAARDWIADTLRTHLDPELQPRGGGEDRIRHVADAVEIEAYQSNMPVGNLFNLGLALTGNGPPPQYPGAIALGGPALGLPVNDALRLAGRSAIPGAGSISGAIRSAGVKAAVDSFLGTGKSIVTLSGETSIASFAGTATTAATAAPAASYVALVKFAIDTSTVLYGAIVACRP